MKILVIKIIIIIVSNDVVSIKSYKNVIDIEYYNYNLRNKKSCWWCYW